MMQITIATLFRDSQVWHNQYIGQVRRFFNQVEEQCRNADVQPNIVCVEGNSHDNTLATLQSYSSQYNLHIIQQESNYKDVRSTGDPVRLKELSCVGETCLLAAAQQNTEFIWWVESDLVMYDPYILRKFLDNLKSHNDWGLCGGLVFTETFMWVFYDTWAYIHQGVNFTNQTPWHSCVNQYERFIELDSLGSTALIRADLVKKGASFQTGAFLRLCELVREQQYKVIADKSCFIYHPSRNGFAHGRLI